MAGDGAPDPQVFDASGLKVAVVAASWHAEVMDGLIAGAERALGDFNADALTVRVPGTFELPVVADALAGSGYDAVVALGVVVRGGTPHFEYVCNAATDGLTRVALDHRVATIARVRPAAAAVVPAGRPAPLTGPPRGRSWGWRGRRRSGPAAPRSGGRGGPAWR